MLPIGTLCLCVFSLTAAAGPADHRGLGTRSPQDPPKVNEDPENVVAGHLVGSWKVHARLTSRLVGGVVPEPARPDSVSISFEADATVVDQIPQRLWPNLSESWIYMAGTLRLRSKPHPFLLVEQHGNPHLIYFRERAGDPFGDSESFKLFIAPAEEREDDLLFVGGDFNNQAFEAFERSRGGASTRPEADKQRTAEIQILNFASAIDQYRLIHSGRNPESLEQLIEPDPVLGEPILDRISLDPWEREYVYEVLEDGSAEVLSYGADGRAGGDGANADIRLSEIRSR